LDISLSGLVENSSEKSVYFDRSLATRAATSFGRAYASKFAIGSVKGTGSEAEAVGVGRGACTLYTSDAPGLKTGTGTYGYGYAYTYGASPPFQPSLAVS
jgi:hypothetical protein